MVLVSGSRNTELLPIANMLASSWVTITTVAPRLSRSSRIRSSRSLELIGSSPHGIRPHGALDRRVLAVALHEHLGGAEYVEVGDQFAFSPWLSGLCCDPL